MTYPSSERQARLPGWIDRPLGRLEDDRLCWLILGAGVVIYAALALWLTRDTTLYVDEYLLFVNDHGLRPYELFSPVNGHLLLVSKLIYAVGFKLFGADFLVFRLIEVVGAALAVGVLFALVKRRIGGAAALALALLLLFLGSVWEITFIVSGFGNVYCVAAGLGALLALDRGTSRGDVAACTLLIVSIAATTFGLAFAIGAGILVTLRGERSRLWVALAPLALWVAWLLWVRAVYVPEHGNTQAVHLSNVLLIPNFIADEAAAVAGVLAGLNFDFTPEVSGVPGTPTSSQYGPLIAVAAAVALGLRLRRGNVTPFLWAAISILLAIWIFLALGYGPGRNPTTVRYTYPGAVLVLLIAAEALRGVRPSRTALLVLFAVTAMAISTNLGNLREGMKAYREFTLSLRAQLAGIELARDRVDPTYIPPTGSANFDIVQAGPYLAAVDRIGSPAFSTAELTQQSEDHRHDADEVIVTALGIEAAPAQPNDRGRSCRRLPAAPDAPLALVAQPPGVLLRSRTPAKVALRRFATTATVPIGRLDANQPAAIRIPTDRTSQPWHLTVTPTDLPGTPAREPVTACQLRLGSGSSTR